MKPATFFEDIDDFNTEITDYHPNRGDARLLVCLHGFGGNTRTFLRLAPKIPEAFRLWSISLPWHGNTTSENRVMQLEAYTHALARMLQNHKFGCIQLMAHSFGARIAAMFAALYPERIERLYLIAPGGYYPPEDLMFRFLGSWPMHSLIKNDMILRPFARFLIPGLPAEKELKTINALRHIGWSFPAISLKARGELSKLKIYKGETVLILGGKDRLLRASYAPKIARYYHNCRTEIISGAGHLPMVTHPGIIARLLR